MTTRTVGVLIYRDDELVVRHGRSAGHLTGVYGLPAGRLRGNESEKTACLRELTEETGLISNKESLIELPRTYTARIERKDGVKVFSLKVYLCKSFSGTLRATSETSPEWVKITEFGNYDLLPNVNEIINEGLNFR